MPVDPSIALSIKPAQIESPLAAYSQVLGIKNQQQQQAEGAQKIQSNAITLQEQQRAMEYQKTFTDALQKHTTANPDGTLATDWGGIQNAITNAGYGPEALKLSGDRAAAQEAGLKLLHAQNQADLDKAQSVGRVLGAIPVVDQTAPPETQAVQKAAWNAAAPAAVASLVAQGHMTQQDGAGLLQQLQQSGGWTPQFAALIDQKKMEGLTTEQQVQHIQNGINAARLGDIEKANKAHLEAETAGLQATQADKQRSDAAALLSQATSAADYDKKLATVDKAVAAKLPASGDLDFSDKSLADTQERILKSGMNAEQIAQHDISKANSLSLAESRKNMEDIRKDNLEIRKQLLAGQPSPAQKAAVTKLDGLTKTEAPLWKQAAQLATALGDGANVTTFIGENGGPATMTSKTAGNADAAKGLVADMKTRLADSQAQLRNVINRKYNLVEAQGGEPSVSRENALAAVDKLSLAGKPTPAPAAAKPAAAPAAAAAKPAAAAPIGNFPSDLAGAMQVGTPREIKLRDGSTITVVKQADGKVYKQ